MKKVVLVLILLLTVVGCKEKFKKPTVYGDNDTGLVIAYRRSQSGVENAISYEVNLYNRKEITYGYSNQDGFSSAHLTDEQYNEILDFAFSEKFLSLKSENIGEEVEGGHYESITLIYDDKVFTLGNNNISNEDFIKLRELLLKYK